VFGNTDLVMRWWERERCKCKSRSTVSERNKNNIKSCVGVKREKVMNRKS
jgi:hypothetical protein